MADDKSDLLAEFEQFLAAKKDKETAEKDAEDFELEIWDEKGRGIRTRRSHAKPFLQSLGLDLDAESEESDADNSDGNSAKNNPKNARQSKGTPGGAQSVTRKYFVKGK